MPFGLLFVIAVLVSVLAPPAYTGILLIEGHYILGFAVLVGWFGWLYFNRRLLRWTFQGMEYSSL